jgi:hypothetical protein
MKTKPDVIDRDKKSQFVFTPPEYSALSMSSESEVRVFPKQLKHLTTVQYVITQKH